MMEKDWTGNSNSVFKMLGASNHAEVEREAKDFYATDPVAIDLLLKKVSLSHKVLEPACGNGCLSTRLLERGHEVHSYDIVDRGYGEVQNFFEMLTPPIEGDFSIVTNPPYKYATEFVRHALDIVPDGCLVAMFLKTTFAEGKRRWNEIFKFTPPHYGVAMRRESAVCQERRLRLYAQERRKCRLLCVVGMEERI